MRPTAISTRSAASVCDFPVFVRERNRRAVRVVLHRFDFRLGENLDAFFLKSFLEFGGDFVVFDGSDARQHFEHGDLRPERIEDRSELDAHRARSHDHQRLGHGGELQNFDVAQDDVAVDLDAGKRARAPSRLRT